MTIHNPDAKIHQCDRCPLSFFFRYQLFEHMRCHTDTLKFPCTSCGKVYRSKGSLLSHKMKFHPTECNPKMKHCHVCFKACVTSWHLKKHLRVHEPQKPKKVPLTAEERRALSVFECGICQKMFMKMVYLKEHMDYAHSDVGKYECPDCKQSFTHRYKLYSHRSKCGKNVQDQNMGNLFKNCQFPD